jgi:aspartate aminotransferase
MQLDTAPSDQVFARLTKRSYQEEVEMTLSNRVGRMGTISALGIHYRVREMLRQGRDVLSLAVGEPDFDTPAHIKKAGIEAIEEGWTKYSVTPGLPELKEAVCHLLKERCGLTYDAPNVIISIGAKQSVVNAMLALLEPGDEVLIPIPAWFSYTVQVRFLDAVPVLVPTYKEDEFELKADVLAEKITPKTRLLILNTPSNPTGAMVSKSELEKIAELAVKHGFYVISDEIYNEIVFGDHEHFSIAGFGTEINDLTITINGFSKAYAMTGWRVGYGAGPKPVIDAMSAIQLHFTSGTNTMAQRAAIAAAYGPQDCVTEMLQEYDRRRSYIVERLNGIEGISCLTPQGTFYAFPDISQLIGRSFGGTKINDSIDVGNHLLEAGGVGVIPGKAFEGEGHIRISFACDIETIKDGCDRIERALSE